jgi:hypothetical protein
MDERRALMLVYATKYPRSYWLLQGSSFYGLLSLVNEVGSDLGWLTLNPWPARALGAAFFGGAMLWVVRRQKVAAPDIQSRQ